MRDVNGFADYSRAAGNGQNFGGCKLQMQERLLGVLQVLSVTRRRFVLSEGLAKSTAQFITSKVLRAWHTDSLESSYSFRIAIMSHTESHRLEIEQ